MRKIAAITVFCNEDFRIENWQQFYNEYKNELDYHVIVNNGDEKDCALLQLSFPSSVVLYSPGMNLLRAYNTGLRYIYDNFQVDAIMQITNDIRFEKGAITKLLDCLFDKSTLAVVGPVVLAKDSDVIESFGYKTNGYWGLQWPINCGKKYSELTEEFQYVTFIPAGVIMIKAEAWKKIGFQDETIEMYCDEWDMFIRFDKLGYKEGVLASAKAWHQHIARPGASAPRPCGAYYKTARNHIYITRKHCGKAMSIVDFFLSSICLLFHMFYHILKMDFSKLQTDLYSLKGSIDGISYK